jgi:hypothetical protein
MTSGQASTLRRTALYPQHLALGGRMVACSTSPTWAAWR